MENVQCSQERISYISFTLAERFTFFFLLSSVLSHFCYSVAKAPAESDVHEEAEDHEEAEVHEGAEVVHEASVIYEAAVIHEAAIIHTESVVIELIDINVDGEEGIIKS